MEIFLFWVILSFVVGAIASGRNIGFWGGLLASLFLSPLIGLIIVLTSKDKKEEAYKQQALDLQKKSRPTQ